MLAWPDLEKAYFGAAQRNLSECDVESTDTIGKQMRVQWTAVVVALTSRRHEGGPSGRHEGENDGAELHRQRLRRDGWMGDEEADLSCSTAEEVGGCLALGKCKNDMTSHRFPSQNEALSSEP